MSRIVFGLMWVLHFFPLAFIALVGERVGAVLFWLIPERRRVTRVNLAKCFPDMNAEAREALARAHFRAFTRSFVERGLLWWARRARIERLVRIEGLEHLRAVAGKPVILFVPHFVGLDAGLTRLTCEADLVIMYAHQKNPRYGTLLRRGRSRFGRQRLVSRQEGVRVALGAMKEGRPFYYLPDQDYGRRDALFVPFFGVAAATVPGLPRMARLAGAAVLPCVTRMLPGGAGYVLSIEPAWTGYPTADPGADTLRMNRYLERKILEMPEQYFWLHKRFKTRPEGEAGFYS